ncbi:MAG: response regulator transcription factor [Planctomycetaceae bacterium]|nr:response regulator transcription factor [Planctomycetaceae bacterium]
MSIRLLIADDHELVRTGIISLLSGTDIEVVAQAASGPEAVTLAKQHTPDVVLLDIRMNDTDGLTAIEEIRRDVPTAKVVMLSTYDNPTYMARANAMGAHDYVLKGASQEQLVGAIRAAFEGRAPSEYGELAKVAGTMATRQKQAGSDIQLTQRETQVLRHLALGLSNKEIAQSLSISIETVKEHVQHLLRKMDVADRTQAAVWAVRNGLV